MNIERKIIIEELQVVKDTKITVIYIGSPYIKSKRKKKVFEVFYIEDDGNDIKRVEVPCNKFQLIYPGYVYKNGEYMGVSNEEVNRIVAWDKAYNKKENLPLNVLIEEKGYKLPDNVGAIAEKYISFVVEGVTYTIPCIQIIQTFFANHKMLLKWILEGKTGFDDLIESENISIDYLQIHFMPWLVDMITRSTVGAIAQIRYVPEMQREWQEVVTTYIEQGTLISQIPSIPGLRISCEGIMINKKFYINRIIWLDAPELKLNGETFSYIKPHPEKEKKHRDKGNKEKKHNEAPLQVSESDSIILRDKSSQQGKRSSFESRSMQGFTLCSRIKSGGKDTLVPYRQVVGINEDTNDASLNDPTDNGTVPQVNIDFTGSWQETPIIEGFEKFCLAIGEMQKYKKIEFRIFSGCIKCASKKNDIPEDNILGKKYVVAVIKSGGSQKWLILEPEGESASTLFITAEGDEEVQAEKMMSNLVKVGYGQWKSECFENITLPHNDLKHYKNRPPQTWARLMLEKIFGLK